jgi:alpha-amylase
VVQVKKEIKLRSGVSQFDIDYTITNRNTEELNTTFGPEFNFSLLAGNADDRYYEIPGHVLDRRNLASAGETNNVSRMSLVDEWLKLRLTLAFSQPAVLWRAPVETVSQSEAGFERVYQSSMVLPLWLLSVRPGASWNVQVSVSIEQA